VVGHDVGFLMLTDFSFSWFPTFLRKPHNLVKVDPWPGPLSPILALSCSRFSGPGSDPPQFAFDLGFLTCLNRQVLQPASRHG
jgi:hypothetical protein